MLIVNLVRFLQPPMKALPNSSTSSWIKSECKEEFSKAKFLRMVTVSGTLNSSSVLSEG